MKPRHKEPMRSFILGALAGAITRIPVSRRDP